MNAFPLENKNHVRAKTQKKKKRKKRKENQNNSILWTGIENQEKGPDCGVKNSFASQFPVLC